MKNTKQWIKRLLTLLAALLMAVTILMPGEAFFARAEDEEEEPVLYLGTASVALKVRKEPSKNARGIDSIPQYSKVYVLEVVDTEWLKIKTDYTVGYVLTKYVTNLQDVSGTSLGAEQNQPPDGSNPFVAETDGFKEGYRAFTLNSDYLHEEPDMESGRVIYIPYNEEITVSTVSGDWCLARYRGEEGYILNSSLYKWDRLDPYAGEIPGLAIMPKIAFLKRTAEVYSMEDNSELKDYAMPPGSCIAVFEKDEKGRYQTPYHRTMGYVNEDAVDFVMDVVPWEEAQPGDLISAMTTYYAVGVSNPQYQGRNWNVYLASSMISGTVLQPGQSFDMNDTIGPYRKSTGYHSAPIMSSEASTGYGGGTCQVNTTFYIANIQLPILINHRRVHADSGIYYVPQGFDAAVGSGNINLQLTNTLPYAIRYQYFMSDGVMTCCIFRES